MTSNKKKFYLIILAIILLSALILRISSKSTSQKVITIESTKVSDAKEQSYISNKYPELNFNDKIFGDKNAKLKIFVYEDYSNILSAQLDDTLEKIKLEKKDLNIIVRPYVSADILSKNAALALACSDDKWVEMRALLFAQVKNKQINIDNFSANAKQIGLNEENFTNCLTNPEISRTIEKSMEESKAFSVLGAPTTFVGDELVIGARPYDNFTDSNGDKIEGLENLINRKLGK